MLFICISCSREVQKVSTTERYKAPVSISFEDTASIIPPAPIITYHRISTEITNGMTITPELFERHMRFLYENGYNPITMDKWCSAVLYGASLPDKPVLITFDDAWKSQYENALPILNKFGFKATFYTYSSVVGHKTFMAWEQLGDLADQGHNIGCHSKNHSNLAKQYATENNQKYFNRLKSEIIDAKKIIENRIGLSVIHFCYPYGYYNTNVIAQLKKAGFVSAVTVNPCPNTIDSSLFKLGRFIIAPWTKEKQLGEKLSLLPLNYKNINPFDGDIRVGNTREVAVVLQADDNTSFSKFQMNWKWKKIGGLWDPETRILSCSFKKPVEKGIYTIQAHAWDEKSNHYVYAWLFQQNQ